MPPQTLDVVDAVGHIPTSARIIASPGCATPTTCLRALDVAADGREWILESGLLLEYPFLDSLQRRALSYRTWHVMAPLRAAARDGLVEYIPLRASDVGAALESRPFDAALVRISPPDARGLCSLGPSASYSRRALEFARYRVGEIDESLPRPCGDATIPCDIFDVFVETRDPTPAYRGTRASERSRAIATRVIELLPRLPVIQVGIGAVPEAVVDLLPSAGLGMLRFVGMATDAMVRCATAGCLDRRALDPPILTPELMGTAELMAFSDQNSLLGLYSSDIAHDVVRLGSLERFVSINSGLEIDLSGAVNAESIGGFAIGAIGGSVDYHEAARLSRDGRRIVALPATSSDGLTSRIVAKLGAGVPVTLARSLTDYVVTEFGVAKLAGRSLGERAESLIAIAHPDHRDRLAAEFAALNAARP